MSGARDSPPTADCAAFRVVRDGFDSLIQNWELSSYEIATLLGLASYSLDLLPNEVGSLSAESETRMRCILEIDQLLQALLGDRDDCRTWLRRPNPGILGHRTPVKMMSDGAIGLRRVRDALQKEAALAGVGAAC
jgi:uncharacterized protein (DUF2384 family)